MASHRATDPVTTPGGDARAPKQGYRQQRGDIGLRTAVHKILRLERLIFARGRPIPPSSTRGSHRHRRRLGDPRSSAPTRRIKKNQQQEPVNGLTQKTLCLCCLLVCCGENRRGQPLDPTHASWIKGWPMQCEASRGEGGGWTVKLRGGEPLPKFCSFFFPQRN